MDGILIGIDGGGSGCRVAIRADGRRVEAAGGPANVTLDEECAVANVLAVLREAASRAGFGRGDLAGARCHAGLAGVLDGGAARRVARALEAGAGVAPPSVSDDRLTTLTGALGAGDGWIFSAGTGSFAGCRDGGAERFLGGWGWVLGDQASGAVTGREALRAALLAHDGIGAPSGLADELLAWFGGDPGAMVTFARSASAGAFAEFAPRVVAAAEAGDPLGRRLMAEGAEHIAGALQALGYRPGGRLCLAGGFGPAFASYLPGALREGLTDAEGTPLDGALALAEQGA